MGTVRMRHGGFQVINSGTLREIFKITAWVITELPQLSYIMRLSFVLIMKVSIKLPLHEDKRSYTSCQRNNITERVKVFI